MALAINIDDLLNKQRIESNRIEFKKGWNPASIYHSVCAFANDFDNLGGGYIVVGVDTDEATGVAIRPVNGIPTEMIDGILQDMVGYNNKISPYYMPRTSVNVLVNNGSPRANVVTDEERTFFRITIPCNEAAGNIIADIAHKDGSLKVSKRGSLKTALQSAPETALQSAPETALQIIKEIRNNPNITLSELAEKIGVSRRWIATNIKHLQDTGAVKRIGPNKGGYWEIIV